MNLVEDNVILLAGATGRVGGATLATLVREGARVAVLSRGLERARATIADVLAAAQRERALPIRADLSDPASAAAAVAECVKAFGRIDALVNLAGSGGGRIPLTESKLGDLHFALAAFTETAYNLALPALRAMLAQAYRDGARSRGRIVTVTAGSSKAPAPGRGAFATAKAGVNALMLAIAREHKADGIVANALVLGGVAFAGAEAFYSPADFAAAATPQEVADALTFLASDRASGINGALVDLNAREID
jgi:meso-butanediol dehydrogenase / (S,S)-butanediol dehydrogenase / diacetyl reductase